MRTGLLKGASLWTVWGAIITLYFWEPLSRPVLMAERDLSTFFFPGVKVWVDALRAGEFPLWNPYSFAGQPLFASLQTAVLYPPNLLLFFFPIVPAFNGTLALHFFLAGWFAYLLARELGSSPGAAVVTVLGFSLGGFLLSLHSVLSSLQSAVWAPLILWSLLRALKGSSVCYGLLTAVFISVQFLGGGIEIFLLTQALVVLVLAFPQALLSGERREPWRRRLKIGLVMYLVFFGLNAVQILPFLEMVRESGRGEGLSYWQATVWSLPFQDLWYLFFPDFFWRGVGYYFEDQNWLKSIYLGFIPFGLLIFYFRIGGVNRGWWGGLVLLSLLLALGRNTPLYELLYRMVPGVSLIRYPVKFFFLAQLFLCLLAGFGWDALTGRLQTAGPAGWPGLKKAAMGLGLLLALLLLTATLFYPSLLALLNEAFPENPNRPWESNLHNLIRFGIVTLLALVVLIFMADRKCPPLWGGRLLIFLMGADLFLGNWGQFKMMDREAYFRAGPNLEIVRQDPEPSRVYTQIKVLKALIPIQEPEWMFSDVRQERFYLDYPAVHRVANAHGFPVLVFKPVRDLLQLLETSPAPESTHVLSLMNVRYLVWLQNEAGEGFRLMRLMEPVQLLKPGIRVDPARPETLLTGRPGLYRLDHSLPRAALIPHARVVKNQWALRDLIKDRGFDPRRTVLLYEEPIFPPGEGGGGAVRDEIQWLENGNHHLSLLASCSGPRILLLNETDYPGWRVWVDGRPGRIYRANHAFRAVPLAPGTHRIEMIYRPASFYGGLAVSGVTLMGLLSWAGRGWVRKGRKRKGLPVSKG